MPPVLGPSSPSKIRLKSCASSSGTTVPPSQMQKRLASGPSRNSSTTTAASPPFARQVRACSRAASRSSVTTTPLPAARPSSLMTKGDPKASIASATWSIVVHTCAIAVGTPAAAMTSLA